MRIKVTIALILVAGIVLAVILRIDNRILSPVELENVRMVCLGCHGQVPQYEFAQQVHDRHAVFECSFCHRDIGLLKATDSIHRTLKWLGVGTLSLALIGVIANFSVSNGKRG